MITQVMDYCNNHFLRTGESPDLTFKDTAGTYTIEGDFGDTYIVGQYVYIYGSLLNDGAYKITEIATGVLTVDTATVAELPTATENTIYIFGLAVPRSFLSIVTDIETWVAANGGKEGIGSEKIDDYQINYFASAGGGQGGNTWQGAFNARLSRFKSIFNDIERYCYGYY